MQDRHPPRSSWEWREGSWADSAENPQGSPVAGPSFGAQSGPTQRTSSAKEGELKKIETDRRTSRSPWRIFRILATVPRY